MRSSSSHLKLVVSTDAQASVEARAFEITAELFFELRKGDAAAQRSFVKGLWSKVGRILRSVLGAVNDLDDLTQEVFIRVLDRIGRVAGPDSLGPFVRTTTLFVARESIRSRARRRWLLFRSPEELPELSLPGVAAEVAFAVEAFYRVVSELALDDRVAFLLRHIEGMELGEIAAATETSLSTVKRRLSRAEAEFIERSRAQPELVRLLEEGAKWHIVHP